MSESKLILKVELKDNKPVVTLGTRHPALLSLALQLADLQVKENILNIDDMSKAADASDIIVPGSSINVPSDLLKQL